MVALISFLFVIATSLLITHIAAVALTLTGLSPDVANFQARSAFTGVGFTTKEAEKVVNFPVRRRILMILMVLGNAGFVTAVSSLILTFIDVGTLQKFFRLGILSFSLLVLWITSHKIDPFLSIVISWALRRWSQVDTRDYANLLNLVGDYSVSELQVESADWLADKTLAELDLGQEGVIVLGIRRSNGNYVGAPGGETEIEPGDTLLLYGREPLLSELNDREADVGGEMAHQEAIAEQQDVLEKQSKKEKERIKDNN